MKKNKAHIIYKTKSGLSVPGVTTIIGLLDKPALKVWANKIGLQGISLSKYVDDKADIGTLAHKMILNYFGKKETDTQEYSASQITQAENCLISFFNWEKQHKIDIIELEYSAISNELLFGGTFDMLAEIDNIKTLLDFKTGSGIYPEYFYQLGGYDILIKENLNIEPEKYMILNIPRIENENFKYEEKKNVDVEREIFKHLLKIYHLKKELK